MAKPVPPKTKALPVKPASAVHRKGAPAEKPPATRWRRGPRRGRGEVRGTYAADDVRVIAPAAKVFDASLSHSAIGCYMTCPRMFLYEYRLRLKDKGYASAPNIGQLFHLAVGLRYRGFQPNAISTQVSAWLDKQIAQITLTYEEGPGAVIFGGQSLEDVVEQCEQDASIAQAMASAFWQRYSPRLPKYDTCNVECRVEFRDPFSKAQLVAVIDLLLFDPKSKRYYIVDNKTTSSRVDEYATALEFDPQARLYAYVVRLALEMGLLGLEPYPVAGFIHNVVQKPTIRLKQGQDIADYIDEVAEWYSGTGRWTKRADIVTEQPPFASYLTPATGQLDAELQLVLREVATATSCAPTLTNFPRLGAFRGVCKNHFNRKCRHVEMCTRSTSDWAELLQNNYLVRSPSTGGSA